MRLSFLGTIEIRVASEVLPLCAVLSLIFPSAVQRVIISCRALRLILPAELKADALMWYLWTDGKHKATRTKKRMFARSNVWFRSIFRPSSAIQTERVLFMFFGQNIPLFYAKICAACSRLSLFHWIWPVPAWTFHLTQVLLYLAPVDLSSPVCVPGGFSHPLLSRWNWIANPPPPPPIPLPSLLSAEKGNGQDVKLALICCSREWAQYETHYIKKHFEFHKCDWPIHWQLCKQVLKV